MSTARWARSARWPTLDGVVPRRRRGTFLILTVAGLFLLLAAAALVTDIGYARAEQVRIQGILDAAALSVLATADVSAPDLEAAVTRRIAKVARANGVDPEALDVAWTVLDRQAILEIQARLRSPAFLGRALGREDLEVLVRARATGELPPESEDEQPGGRGGAGGDGGWSPGWGDGPSGGAGGGMGSGGGPQVIRRRGMGNWTFGGDSPAEATGGETAGPGQGGAHGGGPGGGSGGGEAPPPRPESVRLTP